MTSQKRLTARDLISLVLDDDSWTSWDTPPVRDGISEAYAAELESLTAALRDVLELAAPPDPAAATAPR